MKTNQIFSIIILGIILTFNSCIDGQKSSEELKRELQEAESSERPWEHFTIINHQMSPNLITEETFFSNAEYDGYLLTGTIKNTSTTTKYKDVLIIITTMTQTETALEVFKHTIYEYFEPNVEVSFKAKINPQKEFKYYQVVVVDAKKIH